MQDEVRDKSVALVIRVAKTVEADSRPFKVGDTPVPEAGKRATAWETERKKPCGAGGRRTEYRDHR